LSYYFFGAAEETAMLRSLPLVDPSIENCGLQFGDEHQDLFLRCEGALSLLMAIPALMPEEIEDAPLRLVPKHFPRRFFGGPQVRS
jgi:hypothetical protein